MPAALGVPAGAQVIRRGRVTILKGSPGAASTSGPVQLGPGIGAVQHGDLMPQHDQFRDVVMSLANAHPSGLGCVAAGLMESECIGSHLWLPWPSEWEGH